MKTQTIKLKNAILMVALTAATFSGAMGNDEQYLNSEPIDINGYVQEAPVSDHELESVKNELRKQKNAIVINKEKSKTYEQLSRSTEKLADVTEDLIEERKDSQQNIDKYNKKIECLMNDGRGRDCEQYVKNKHRDEVSTHQAAAKVETKVKHNPDYKFGEKIKVLPYTGLTTFMSDNENLEANITAGVRVESDLSGRFSVGVGFNYTTMNSQDFGNNNYNSYGFGNGYYDAYGSGREIEYRNLNFDIYTKYFFLRTERFKPYFGAGIGYNRSTIEYKDNGSNSYNYNSNVYNFGGEDVTSSHVNLELMVGSEISFTEMFGMNLELQYTKGIGGNIGSENGTNYAYAPDQDRLENLSSELGGANIVSIFAGMLISF